MKVLTLATYPSEAAATRFRVEQFVQPLVSRGINIDVRPFLSGEQFGSLYREGGTAGKLIGMAGSVVRRIGGLLSTGRYDLLFIQREAMPFGPAVFEYLFQKIGRLPMVLDLDDATYVRYVSPTYGRLGSALKFFGKTDNLIDRADLVISGNRFIAEYVERRGSTSIVIPTIVDTDIFRPIVKDNEVPVIGWIGTHSTFPFIEKIFPVMRELTKKHQFKLLLVGSGRETVVLEGVEVETVRWSLEREVSDFQGLDIGLYPISTSASASEDWLAGKSGFKAIQYMAVGLPFVMSPVGVCGEIGVHGETHFNAESDEDWYNYLDALLSDQELRLKMGVNSRRYSIEHFHMERHAETLAQALNSVVGGVRN
jgi:glycosyltransferase involved in cell wall biosynthesis